MYTYNKDRDGIYVVIDGREYRLQYDSSTIAVSQSKCAKCDFFNGSCGAGESCRKIESQFPDSYWKLVVSNLVPCGGAQMSCACNENPIPDGTGVQDAFYTVGGSVVSDGDFVIMVDGEGEWRD